VRRRIAAERILAFQLMKLAIAATTVSCSSSRSSGKMGSASTSWAARSATGKLPSGSQASESRLHVQGNRVIDLRADAAHGEKLAQGIAARGADYVLVPDVAATRNLMRQNHAMERIRAGFANPAA